MDTQISLSACTCIHTMCVYVCVRVCVCVCVYTLCVCCVFAGPTPITIVDFWRMIWQERVPAIVMITNLVEGKKTKCEQYWPLSGSLGFGPFQVSITNQLILADYTINTLSVEVKTNCVCSCFQY